MRFETINNWTDLVYGVSSVGMICLKRSGLGNPELLLSLEDLMRNINTLSLTTFMSPTLSTPSQLSSAGSYFFRFGMVKIVDKVLTDGELDSGTTMFVISTTAAYTLIKLYVQGLETRQRFQQMQQQGEPPR